MPTPSQPLRRLGFLTIGLFDPSDPAAGHESTADVEDFSKARVERLASFIAGTPVREFSGKQGVVEEFSNRVEPYSPACANASGTGQAAWDRPCGRASRD